MQLSHGSWVWGDREPRAGSVGSDCMAGRPTAQSSAHAVISPVAPTQRHQPSATNLVLPAQCYQPNATNLVPPTWSNQTSATREPPVQLGATKPVPPIQSQPGATHHPNSTNLVPPNLIPSTWCHQPGTTTPIPSTWCHQPTSLSHPHPWPLGKPLNDGPSISHPCMMGFSPATPGS